MEMDRMVVRPEIGLIETWVAWQEQQACFVMREAMNDRLETRASTIHVESLIHECE
jgi:hypothetical protein